MRRRKRKKECGAAADFALGPDASAVTLDDPSNRGEAYAGAREFMGLVQPLKGPEKFTAVLHVKAGAVILDEINLFAVDTLSPKNNASVGLLACKLPGIGQKIFQRDPDKGTVAGGQKVFLDLCFHLTAFIRRFEFIKDFLNHLTDVNAFGPHLRAGELGKIQKVIYDAAHLLRGRADSLQGIFAFSVELVGAVFEPALAETLNAAQALLCCGKPRKLCFSVLTVFSGSNELLIHRSLIMKPFAFLSV